MAATSLSRIPVPVPTVAHACQRARELRLASHAKVVHRSAEREGGRSRTTGSCPSSAQPINRRTACSILRSRTDAERAADGEPSFASDSGEGIGIISELMAPTGEGCPPPGLEIQLEKCATPRRRRWVFEEQDARAKRVLRDRPGELRLCPHAHRGAKLLFDVSLQRGDIRAVGNEEEVPGHAETVDVGKIPASPAVPETAACSHC